MTEDKRVAIKNKHCLKWLQAYINRLQDIHDKISTVSKQTKANIRFERIEAHLNKHYESYYTEFSDFENEKRYTLKIRVSEYKMNKNKHNIY